MATQAARRMTPADKSGLADFERKAAQAAGLLKLLANENRLLILCRLALAKEMSVNDLATAVGLSQCGKKSALSREQVAERATAIVNVNTAPLEELMTLPRVNDNLAHRIIAGRPYSHVDDLKKVSGIGPKTLDGFRARVTVDPPGK